MTSSPTAFEDSEWILAYNQCSADLDKYISDIISTLNSHHRLEVGLDTWVDDFEKHAIPPAFTQFRSYLESYDKTVVRLFQTKAQSSDASFANAALRSLLLAITTVNRAIIISKIQDHIGAKSDINSTFVVSNHNIPEYFAQCKSLLSTALMTRNFIKMADAFTTPIAQDATLSNNLDVLQVAECSNGSTPNGDSDDDFELLSCGSFGDSISNDSPNLEATSNDVSPGRLDNVQQTLEGHKTTPFSINAFLSSTNSLEPSLLPTIVVAIKFVNLKLDDFYENDETRESALNCGIQCCPLLDSLNPVLYKPFIHAINRLQTKYRPKPAIQDDSSITKPSTPPTQSPTSSVRSPTPTAPVPAVGGSIADRMAKLGGFNPLAALSPQQSDHQNGLPPEVLQKAKDKQDSEDRIAQAQIESGAVAPPELKHFSRAKRSGKVQQRRSVLSTFDSAEAVAAITQSGFDKRTLMDSDDEALAPSPKPTATAAVASPVPQGGEKRAEKVAETALEGEKPVEPVAKPIIETKMKPLPTPAPPRPVPPSSSEQPQVESTDGKVDEAFSNSGEHNQTVPEPLPLPILDRAEVGVGTGIETVIRKPLETVVEKSIIQEPTNIETPVVQEHTIESAVAEERVIEKPAVQTPEAPKPVTTITPVQPDESVRSPSASLETSATTPNSKLFDAQRWKTIRESLSPDISPKATPDSAAPSETVPTKGSANKPSPQPRYISQYYQNQFDELESELSKTLCIDSVINDIINQICAVFPAQSDVTIANHDEFSIYHPHAQILRNHQELLILHQLLARIAKVFTPTQSMKIVQGIVKNDNVIRLLHGSSSDFDLPDHILRAIHHHISVRFPVLWPVTYDKNLVTNVISVCVTLNHGVSRRLVLNCFGFQCSDLVALPKCSELLCSSTETITLDRVVKALSTKAFTGSVGSRVPGESPPLPTQQQTPISTSSCSYIHSFEYDLINTTVSTSDLDFQSQLIKTMQLCDEHNLFSRLFYKQIVGYFLINSSGNVVNQPIFRDSWVLKTFSGLFNESPECSRRFMHFAFLNNRPLISFHKYISSRIERIWGPNSPYCDDVTKFQHACTDFNSILSLFPHFLTLASSEPEPTGAQLRIVHKHLKDGAQADLEYDESLIKNLFFASVHFNYGITRSLLHQLLGFKSSPIKSLPVSTPFATLLQHHLHSFTTITLESISTPLLSQSINGPMVAVEHFDYELTGTHFDQSNAGIRTAWSELLSQIANNSALVFDFYRQVSRTFPSLPLHLSNCSTSQLGTHVSLILKL